MPTTASAGAHPQPHLLPPGSAASASHLETPRLPPLRDQGAPPPPRGAPLGPLSLRTPKMGLAALRSVQYSESGRRVCGVCGCVCVCERNKGRPRPLRGADQTETVSEFTSQKVGGRGAGRCRQDHACLPLAGDRAWGGAARAAGGAKSVRLCGLTRARLSARLILLSNGALRPSWPWLPPPPAPVEGLPPPSPTSLSVLSTA